MKPIKVFSISDEESPITNLQKFNFKKISSLKIVNKKVPIVEKKLSVPRKQEVLQSMNIRRVFPEMISQKNITQKSKFNSIDSLLRPIFTTSNKKNEKSKTVQPPELLKSQKHVFGSLFNITAFLPFLNHSSSKIFLIFF